MALLFPERRPERRPPRKQYPLDWVKAVQAKGTPGVHEWKVLLDAASYVPTHPLDLAEHPADFVAVSFYKMFGYPTGLGALLIRTEDVGLLKKVCGQSRRETANGRVPATCSHQTGRRPGWPRCTRH